MRQCLPWLQPGSIIADASNALVKVRKTIRPDEKIIERYEDKYNKFRCIYPAMKNVFRTIN